MMTKKVLLVEDIEAFRESLKLFLAPDSYTFFEAPSPEEGIKLLEDNSELRVILLDLSFEYGGSGTKLLDAIKGRAANYRVIILTAHEELLAAEQADAYEVFHYLPKAERSTKQALRFSVAQAFKDLEHERVNRKLKSLLEIQARINAGKPLTETLDLVCQSVSETVGAHTCHIRVYDFQSGDYHLKGFAGPPSIRALFETPKPNGKLFSGLVVNERKAVTIPDLQNDPRFKTFCEDSTAEASRSEEIRKYWSDIGSAHIVPLFTGLFGDEVDAVLNLSSTAIGHFDEDRTNLVKDFETLAKMAITKDWLQRKREEAYEDYGRIGELLDKMSEALGKPDALARIYQSVTEGISDLLKPELVSIFLYNDVENLIENVAELRRGTFNTNSKEAYNRGHSLTGSIFKEGKVIHLPDPQYPNLKPFEDPRFDFANKEAYFDEIPSRTLDHYLGVPIRIGGKVRGVLRVMNKKSSDYDKTETGKSRFCLLPRGFSIDCRNVLEITASHLAVAIRNAELVEKLRSLGFVGRLISSALEINEVLKLTMAQMAEVMQARICMLFLRESDRVVLNQSFGMPEIAGAYYDLGVGVTGRVAQSGKAELQETTGRNDGKYDREINEYLARADGADARIKSLMAVPIKSKGVSVGVMKVINKKGGSEYTDSDLELFATFADYVGVAIENARAIEERKSALSSLVRAVAHEINNTVGLIPTNVSNIRKHWNGADQIVDRALSRIDDVAAQAAEFANRIAGFSATRKEDQKALELNSVIMEWIEMFKEDQKYKDAVSKGVCLVPSFAKEPLSCEIYKMPFVQVIRNIVINAFQSLEHTSTGFVWLRTARGQGELDGNAIVEVEDNGTGIKPEHQARIFEADFSTKVMAKGNGVGLWLVRDHLKQIGGRIDFKTVVGRGTTFRVAIPLKSSAEQVPVAGRKRNDDGASTDCR